MATIDRRKFLGRAGLVVLGSAFLAACGSSTPSSTATQSDNLTGADLEAAAKKEGSVRLYSPDQKLANALGEGFKKQYPWATIEIVVGSQTIIRNRVITESVAGGETADVIICTNAARQALLQNNAVRAVSVPAESALAGDLVDAQHYAHPLYQYVATFVYNKSLVPMSPATMEDLADPSWRGKVTFDMPQNANTGAIFLAGRKKQWGDEKWSTWLDGLKANQVLITPDASTALSNVERGERALGIGSSADAFALAAQSPAKPGFYDQMIPIVQNTWLTAKSQHPAAGKLFANWSMGEAGQQAVASTLRSPVLDIDSPVTLSRLLPAGTTIMPASQLADFYNDPAQVLGKLNQLWPS
jgi:ABC-type Fe3+ transport system substrate-binding protein